MRPIIEQLLSKFHPDFQWEHVKYNALITAANSKLQLEGHRGKLHSDYLDFLQHLGTSDHPMLVILVLMNSTFITFPVEIIIGNR
jgi:hypothetical protein